MNVCTFPGFADLTDFHDYWKDNRTVFKLDSVSFLYIWGSMLTWITITVLCLIIGALSYSKLPVKIPVQWSKGVATSLVNKNWIFICPVICIIIRYLLKPFIYAKLQMNNYYGDIITEYLTNYMCFIVLSVEIFSILFTFGPRHLSHCSVRTDGIENPSHYRTTYKY